MDHLNTRKEEANYNNKMYHHDLLDYSSERDEMFRYSKLETKL